MPDLPIQPIRPISTLEADRASKDQFFRTHPQSPLTAGQKAKFRGLAYFAENPVLVFDLPFEPFTNPEKMTLQTSTGDVQEYVRAGQVHFEIDGQPAVLTVFRDEHGHFLPFADALAGTETYAAGRYLEPEELPGGHLRVDFNRAYNPYCAYNVAFSCPLTPRENRLKVPIRAGEKISPEI